MNPPRTTEVLFGILLRKLAGRSPSDHTFYDHRGVGRQRPGCRHPTPTPPPTIGAGPATPQVAGPPLWAKCATASACAGSAFPAIRSAIQATAQQPPSRTAPLFPVRSSGHRLSVGESQGGFCHLSLCDPDRPGHSLAGSGRFNAQEDCSRHSRSRGVALECRSKAWSASYRRVLAKQVRQCGRRPREGTGSLRPAAVTGSAGLRPAADPRWSEFAQHKEKDLGIVCIAPIASSLARSLAPVSEPAFLSLSLGRQRPGGGGSSCVASALSGARARTGQQKSNLNICMPTSIPTGLFSKSHAEQLRAAPHARVPVHPAHERPQRLEEALAHGRPRRLRDRPWPPEQFREEAIRRGRSVPEARKPAASLVCAASVWVSASKMARRLDRRSSAGGEKWPLPAPALR